MMFRAFLRNLPYLRQQLGTLVANASPNVLCICVITICGYLLSFSASVIPALSVNPGYLLPPNFNIWTPFTFWCLEQHFYEVLIDIITVGLWGKLVEPLWGRLEMVLFFAITNIGVAVLSAFVYFLLYMCSGNTEYLFEANIHGLSGYVAAVLVAGRQIMPDLLIAKTPIGKLTNRTVPPIVLTISLILWAFGIMAIMFPIMFTCGMIVSWTYLRFYQRHGNRGRGDGSESFTFASFFPNVLQPFINAAGTPVYVFCRHINFIGPHVPPAHVPLSSVNVTIPGISDPQNLERRRQIALKALSERLSKTTDSSRQNVLPKSLPTAQAKPFPHDHRHSHDHQHGHDHQHTHGLHHTHGHHHPHGQHPSHGQQHPSHVPQMIFNVPAIALPPPPSMAATSAADTVRSDAHKSDTTVDLLQSLYPVTTSTNSSWNGSTADL